MKKVLSIAISLVIILFVYSRLDSRMIGAAILKTDFILLAASLALLLLLIFASGWRLKLLGTAAGFNMTAREAIEATFVANALNLFIPGKMGDVLKASKMIGPDLHRLPLAVALGVWEKLSELTLLLLIGAVAFAVENRQAGLAAATGMLAVAGLASMLFWPEPSAAASEPGRIRRYLAVWSSMLKQLRQKPRDIVQILVLSTLIWIAHLVQICMMAAALGIHGNLEFWVAIAARLPIAILAGLVPVTFAGIGTRDAALVLLLAPFIGAEKAAALGVLFWLRYLVPGAVSLPYLPGFLRLSASHLKALQNRAASDT